MIKIYLILSVIATCVSFCGISQENLILNGDFESGTYNGGNDPLIYYSGIVGNSSNAANFNDDIDNWEAADPSLVLLNPDSPDWIPGGLVLGDGFCPANSDYYVRSASKRESLVGELKNGYTLVKGQTYKFQIKYRQARGFDNGAGSSSASFQVIFSTKEEGLEVQAHKKWVAAEVYDVHSCDWKSYEVYFTVPNDDAKDYEDMKYIVLQYNNEFNETFGENHNQGDASLILHYDDVYLAESPECEEIKYIQDWQYANIFKIEQANQEIWAGSDVSPYSWPANNPVVVKSSAKVIYRAPLIFLEPGFSTEPGSYFETQIGTCVDDPCPDIPPFATPQSTVCGTTTLGLNNSTEPGVFYEWQPNAYFSDPYSAITDFAPPVGNGCLNASLTIWTICGESITYNFPINYFDSPPVISFSNINSSPNNFSFNTLIENATSYTIEGVNTVTGDVFYSSQGNSSCSTGNNNILQQLEFNSCTNSMCDPIEITVTAENDCFAAVSQTIDWSPPPPVTPTFQIENLVMNDFQLNFNVSGITQNYEFFTIEMFNAAGTELICAQTILSCDQPSLTSYQFDATGCLPSCISQCSQYLIKITLKNMCVLTPEVQTINWNKSVNTLTPQSSWPNVVTADGDGVNDELCFNPVGADQYSIIIIDRLGQPVYESSGCVDGVEVCIWTPNPNLMEATYFYIVQFSNTCGETVQHHDFVQLFNQP